MSLLRAIEDADDDTDTDTGDVRWKRRKHANDLGKLVVVQLGDVVDRGDESARATAAGERLRAEARERGDEFVTLLGNHELMVLQRDLRFVGRREVVALGREALKETMGNGDFVGLGLRAYYYAGARAWNKMFSKNEELGRVLREKPVAVIRGRGRCATVFVHAGLTPAHFASDDGPDVDGLNARVRALIDVDVVDKATDGLLGNDGPLWTRELSQGDESVACEYAELVTRRLGVRRIVVGHTVTKSGVIETRCGGLIHMIDVGMSAAYGGSPSAWMCDEDEGPVAISSSGARTPLE